VNQRGRRARKRRDGPSSSLIYAGHQPGLTARLVQQPGMYHDDVAMMQCLDQMGEGAAQLATALLGQRVAELDRVVS
jgi:hypothetical protein